MALLTERMQKQVEDNDDKDKTNDLHYNGASYNERK